jgi:hypothetical protein
MCHTYITVRRKFSASAFVTLYVATSLNFVMLFRAMCSNVQEIKCTLGMKIVIQGFDILQWHNKFCENWSAGSAAEKVRT